VKLKSDLTRCLEHLEAEGQDRMRVYVWIDHEAHAARLVAEAARNNPDRKIIALSWLLRAEGKAD
jgi:hypothetical protein